MIENSDKKLTSRQIQAIKSKQKIYESAIKLFKEKGYDNVSTRKIANDAGVSNGLVYSYFRNKVDLILEFYKEENEKMYSVFYESIINQNITYKQKLILFNKKIMNRLEHTIGLEFMCIIYSSQASYNEPNKFLNNKNRIIRNAIYDFIKNGQLEGEFTNSLSAETITDMIIQCIQGIIYNWCVEEGNFNLSEKCIDLLSVFLSGIEQ